MKRDDRSVSNMRLSEKLPVSYTLAVPDLNRSRNKDVISKDVGVTEFLCVSVTL